MGTMVKVENKKNLHDLCSKCREQNKGHKNMNYKHETLPYI